MDTSHMSVAQHRAETLARTVFAQSGHGRPATEWTRHRGGLYSRSRYRLWITYAGRREYFECAEVDLSGEAGFRLMEPRLRRWLEQEFRLPSPSFAAVS